MKAVINGSYLFSNRMNPWTPKLRATCCKYCTLFALQKRISINIRQYSKCISLNDVYILSGVRTPIGCFFGKLVSQNVVQLGATALTAAVQRACVAKDEIQEIILGNFFQAGAGLNPAHQIAMLSGLSTSVISSSVCKACASGIKAVMYGCQLIGTNTQEIIAAGGAESLSNVPYIFRRQNKRLGNLCVPDLIFHDGLTDPIEGIYITNFAEEAAKEYKCTRKDQDDYALNSYSRAALAQKEHIFDAEIVPVVLKKRKDKGDRPEEELVCEDEQISRLDIEKFREIPPEIGSCGTVTWGNSSGLHDGAAMLVLASGNYVLKKNLSPLARVVSFADGSLEPRNMALAPSVAVPKALLRANLTKNDISKWEICERFALTTIINARLLKLELDRVNLHGGSISLGHPFGMTGARLIVHLTHVLGSGELGCAVISNSGGGASAIIIEKF